jgi:hypothetical protein
MSSRTSSALAVLLGLAACSSGEGTGDGGALAVGAEDGASGRPGLAKSVPCALAGANRFADECQVERLSEDGKALVVVRHPDGGFRRLVELDGGVRYAAADGAGPARSAARGQDIEVTVDADRYLFPNPGGAHAP